MNSNTLKGVYVPTNPNKYRGNVRNIVFRSSWELRMFRYCDLSDNVLEWSSEEIVIPYKDPFSRGFRRYFPDIYMKYLTKKGDIKQKIIEIKPYAQTKQPKAPKKKTKRYINEVQTYLTNQAKWDAAHKYAKSRRMEFEILTERQLGIY